MNQWIEVFLIVSEIFGLLMVVVDLTDSAQKIENLIDSARRNLIERPSHHVRFSYYALLQMLWRQALSDDYSSGERDTPKLTWVMLIGLYVGLLFLIPTLAGTETYQRLVDTYGGWLIPLFLLLAAVGPYLFVFALRVCLFVVDVVLLRFPLSILKIADRHPNGTLGGIGLFLTVGSSVLQRIG